MIAGRVRVSEIGDWLLSTKWLVGSSSIVIFAVLLFYPRYELRDSQAASLWTWLQLSSRGYFWTQMLAMLAFPFLVSLVFVRSRDEVIRPSYWGLILLLVGFGCVFASLRLEQVRVGLLSLPLVFLGLVWFWLGGRIARGLITSALLLLFLIPVPELKNWLVMQTHSFEVVVTTFAGQLIGIGVDTPYFSGFRDSFIEVWMVMVSVLIADLTQELVLMKWLFILASFPLMLFGRVLHNLKWMSEMTGATFPDWITYDLMRAVPFTLGLLALSWLLPRVFAKYHRCRL